MINPRTPLTAEDLHALAEIVEKWSAFLSDESGEPVIDIDYLTISGQSFDRPGDTMGRIVIDHTGSYWGWVAE